MLVNDVFWSLYDKFMVWLIMGLTYVQTLYCEFFINSLLLHYYKRVLHLTIIFKAKKKKAVLQRIKSVALDEMVVLH